jgi:hypothetical protein
MEDPLTSTHRKQPCKTCGHGKSIHHATRVIVENKQLIRSHCNHPGCLCRDYVPAKKD